MKRLLLILALLLTLPALAALPPLEPEEKAESSTYIVKAKVLQSSSQIKMVRHGYDHHYTLEILVTDVKKGSLSSGQKLKVTCRTTGRRPSGWAGPQGQNHVPKDGSKGIFYLKKDLRLLEPNGWEPLTE